MLPIIFTCTHCTLYPHQSKPPSMTGLYVSIIFTCTHRTHHTPYPRLLERKNMDALYFSGLHTSHTLPTASCKKKYGCYLLFSPAHTAYTTHSTYISPNPTLTGIYVSIIFTCTHCTLYPQLLERKNMDALYFFGLHTSHTLPTASCKKKYGCYLLFSPAHTAHTAHSTHISPNPCQEPPASSKPPNQDLETWVFFAPSKSR